MQQCSKVLTVIFFFNAIQLIYESENLRVFDAFLEVLYIMCDIVCESSHSITQSTSGTNGNFSKLTSTDNSRFIKYLKN